MGLHNYIKDATEKDDGVKALAGYMRERIETSDEHRMWAIKFFSCEVLNFVNVIAQIFFTDAFLGGEFTQYGVEVGIPCSALISIKVLNGILLTEGDQICQYGA